MPTPTLNPPAPVVEDEFDDADEGSESTPDLDGPDDPTGADDDGGGDDHDRGRWVTVATYGDPLRAQIARLKLESEDIPCVLLDENVVATDWLMMNAVGGIKLQVREVDVVRASDLLRSRAAAPEEDDNDAAMPSCPRCGSTAVYPVKFSKRLAFLSILLLGVPIPILTRKLRCTQCGAEFPPEGPRGFPVGQAGDAARDEKQERE